MRPLLLLGVAATALGGCDLLNGGCPDLGGPPTRDQNVEATVVAALPESVVVAFVATPLLPFPYAPLERADERFSAGSDSVRVLGFLTTNKAGPDLVTRLDVRGDTVFVSFDAALVRLACSAGPVPGEGNIQIQLPRGVTVRDAVVVQTGPVRTSAPLVPASRSTLSA